MIKAITAFFSGGIDSEIPEIALLIVSVLGTAAVAGGIIREAEKIWSLTTLLVVGGVTVEAICTFLLFGFDEGIIRSQKSRIDGQQTTIDRQQSTIIALETELRGLRRPRHLDQEQKDRIAAAIKPFPPTAFVAMTAPEAEPWDLVLDISAALKADGWDWKPFPTGLGFSTLQAIDGRPSEGTSILDHIELQTPPALKDVTTALGDAIRNPNVIGMDDVRVIEVPDSSIVIIIVGTKK